MIKITEKSLNALDSRCLGDARNIKKKKNCFSFSSFSKKKSRILKRKRAGRPTVNSRESQQRCRSGVSTSFGHLGMSVTIE